MHTVSEKSKVAFLSVTSNIILVIAKLVIGLVMGSVSVLSEAVHSGMDLLAAGIALFAVKNSDTPPDEEHPYGHGRWENISGAMEALLILVAGIWIIVESIQKIIHPQPMQMIWLGVSVMLGASLINLFVSLRLFAVGKKTDSPALLGDAWHLMTDVWSSASVMVALLLIVLGEHFFPQMEWQYLDPIAGLIVAFIILHTSFKLIRESLNAILDERLPQDEERLIREHIMEMAPTVRSWHKMKSRKSGTHRFVEFHLKVDGQTTVKQAHLLSHRLGDAIEEHYKGTTVNIHFEPCEGHCSPDCLRNCIWKKEKNQ